MPRHKLMSVDIETYSSIDLTKSGVHRYTESPDFGVLIIGFKFDDEEEVRQIDLLSPTLHENYEEQKELMEFRRNLYDPEVTQHSREHVLLNGQVVKCLRSNGQTPWSLLWSSGYRDHWQTSAWL